MTDKPKPSGIKPRDKIVMSPAEIDAFLAERRAMKMSRLSPNGSIHHIAMWSGFLGGEVTNKSRATGQRVQQLRRNPNHTMRVEDDHTAPTLRGVPPLGQCGGWRAGSGGRALAETGLPGAGAPPPEGPLVIDAPSQAWQ